MIITIISLILDGIISVYTNNTMFIPLFTLTSLLITYKNYERKEKIYFIFLSIIGLIYDALYTDIILLNTFVFIIIGLIIKLLNIYLSHKLTSNVVKLLVIIIFYRVITYIILCILNYINFEFIILFKSIYNSIFLNIIYLFIITFIDNKISSK